MKSLKFVITACSIVTAISDIRPGASWVLNGWTYDGLIWTDATQTKPTQAEIASAIDKCKNKEKDFKKYKADLNDATKSDAVRLDAMIKYLQLDK